MPLTIKDYEKLMRRALALAKRAEGFTSPNPMVGAVIVKNGRIIGEGYHHAAGQPHGERMAIADAKKRGNKLKGATIVLNLEPCCHVGRTPPCVDALIEEGIKTVVMGVPDPNPCVCGQGVCTLQDHGLKVVTGVLEKQCRELNEPFFHTITTGRPLVIIKSACSLDGKIATRTGHSQWISGKQALDYSHTLRARYDAICVGRKTVMADDPSLTYRGLRKVGQPLRVILDSSCAIPLKSKVISGNLPGKTLIATTKNAPKSRIVAMEKHGVEVKIFPSKNKKVDLRALVAYIGKRGLNSLLIEGGGEVLSTALFAGIVDRAEIVLAPMIIGGTDAVGLIGGAGVARLEQAPRLDNIQIRRLGEDILVRGTLVRKG